MNQHPLTFFTDHQIVPRPEQNFVVDEIYANWDKYKFFALSCPTGVGKTYIATSIADAVGRAYMLTSTLQLQTQYERSWNQIVNLKGRGNYPCNLNPDFTVDAAPCAANPPLAAECKRTNACAYYNQRNLALQSNAMITNSVYLLYSAHCGFAMDAESPWTKRDVLIFDEAHNVENHLVQFAESTINPQLYHEQFGVATHHLKFTGNPEEDYFTVIQIKDTLMAKADELRQELEEMFPQKNLFGMDLKNWAKGFTSKVAERVKRMNTRIGALDKTIQPLKIFFNTHNTPEELSARWIISKQRDANILRLSPIYGDFLFHAYFGGLADKFVFLSATLGTKEQFCKELGIPLDECLFIETDSPFDPSLSPVAIMPKIKLSKDVYEQNIPAVGKIIDDILHVHKEQRGIIHSVTYDLQTQIYKRVSPDVQKRLLCRDMDVLSTGDRRTYRNEELLSIHESGRVPASVLLSPSMMEGVDLKDDLSEFQVIIKLPWANLGDIRVKTKSGIDQEWYANKMWLSILQASGRSTRHDKDTSITYILDKNFQYFYDQWQHKLPTWFKRRIVFMN